MDVLLNEDEEFLRDQARQFFEAECPTSRVREIEETMQPQDASLWKQIVELGWLGLSLPEAYGGAGAPFTHLGVLFEEVGRALAPIPIHPTVVAALAIAESGSEALREAVLPAAIRGELVLSWAWLEEGGEIDLDATRLEARPDGDSLVLSGHKLFVDGFALADRCLVVCRSLAGARGDEGISLVLVDTSSPGIDASRHPTMAGDAQSEVRFESVRVPLANLVGPLHGGAGAARALFERAVILNCAMIVGATRRSTELAVEYAKERIAFGRPIGGFQAIQHMCANMVTWVDGAELLTREALWRIAEGLPAAKEVATAKAFCNERCQAALREANQIHAGVAQIKEYDLQLWYRRAAAWTMRLGTSIQHRRTIAREIDIVPPIA